MEQVGNSQYTSGSDVICFEPGIMSREGGHIYMNVSGTLRSNPGDNAMSVVCLEGNGTRPSHRGDGWSVGEVMYTLNSTEVHCVCYRIGSYYSNSMKSSNPHSGIYQTEISNTLDNMNCGYPACNQGGVAIVEIHSARASP